MHERVEASSHVKALKFGSEDQYKVHNNLETFLWLYLDHTNSQTSHPNQLDWLYGAHPKYMPLNNIRTEIRTPHEILDRVIKNSKVRRAAVIQRLGAWIKHIINCWFVLAKWRSARKKLNISVRQDYEKQLQSIPIFKMDPSFLQEPNANTTFSKWIHFFGLYSLYMWLDRSTTQNWQVPVEKKDTIIGANWHVILNVWICHCCYDNLGSYLVSFVAWFDLSCSLIWETA